MAVINFLTFYLIYHCLCSILLLYHLLFRILFQQKARTELVSKVEEKDGKAETIYNAARRYFDSKKNYRLIAV